MSQDRIIYRVGYDKIKDIEDVKAVLKLLDLTISIPNNQMPPPTFWDAIEKELLIEVKPKNDGREDKPIKN